MMQGQQNVKLYITCKLDVESAAGFLLGMGLKAMDFNLYEGTRL